MGREQKQISFSVGSELEQALVRAKACYFSDVSDDLMLQKLILLGLGSVYGAKAGSGQSQDRPEDSHSQQKNGGKQ